MQQRGAALKRVQSVVKGGVVLLGCVALLGACGASWTGEWGGTADIGPANAHALALSLADHGSTVTLTDASGDTKKLVVCARTVKNRKLTLVVDTGRPDCSAGEDTRRLRFIALIGAGVIHGDIFQGQQRVGFFRAFRAPASAAALSQPAPTSPAPKTVP